MDRKEKLKGRLKRDRWISADNGDTVSLTRIGERMDASWDELNDIFDQLAALRAIMSVDL